MKPQPYKILAFDTSTEVMSIAVQNGEQVLEFTGVGGAQASSRLIPEIQVLMEKAGLSLQELDGIAFGAGPGAFTGLRASCAVAQGLGFGANVPLLPINTLHAVALQIHAKTSEPKITAALDARMGEIYWQVFDFASDPLGTPVGEPQLSKADSQSFALGTLPVAHALLGLASNMLAKGQQVRPADALPLYVRNKVAETTAEREAAKTREAAKSNEHLVFSHAENGKVVSSIEVMRGVDDAEILNVETLPSHRRRGLAQGLLAQALDWAKQNNRRAVWLEVRASNTGAIALYGKMGFEQISIRVQYYADGEDAIVMKYTL